jgi:hypothetical protein
VIVDRDRIERRIAAAIEHLRGSRYTRSLRAIQRHAYIPEYMATLAYFTAELESLGFDVDFDPVGTLLSGLARTATPTVTAARSMARSGSSSPWRCAAP